MKFKYLLPLITISIVFVSFLQYDSFKDQAYLLRDLNLNSWEEETFEMVKNRNYFLPSLGVTSLPLKTLQAEYFFRNNEYNKSLDLLYESLEINPYIGFTEHYLSLNYDRLKIKDSFYLYAKKAFYKTPNNAAHFGYYAKALNQRNQTDSIVIEFQKVKDKNIQKMWFFFLSSILEKKGYDSILFEYGNEARLKFKNRSKNLELITAYSIFGKENVLKSDSLFSKANKLTESNDFENSFLLYKQAIELYPTNHKYYQNLGLSYSKNNQFNLGIEQFKYVIENLNPKNGENEFYIALGYFNLSQEDLGCSYLKKSYDYGYKPSLQLYKQKCQG